MTLLAKSVSMSVYARYQVLGKTSLPDPLACLKEVFGLLESAFICAVTILLVLTVVFVGFGAIRDAFSARGSRG